MKAIKQYLPIEDKRIYILGGLAFYSLLSVFAEKDFHLFFPFSLLYNCCHNIFNISFLPLYILPSIISNPLFSLFDLIMKIPVISVLFIIFKSMISGILFFFIVDIIKNQIEDWPYLRWIIYFSIIYATLMFFHEWVVVKAPLYHPVEYLLIKIRNFHLRIAYFFIGRPPKSFFSSEFSLWDFFKNLFFSFVKKAQSFGNYLWKTPPKKIVSDAVDKTKKTFTKENLQKAMESTINVAKKAYSSISEIDITEKISEYVDSAKETLSEIDAKEKVSNFIDSAKETISDINVKEKFNNFVDSAKETVSKIDVKEKFNNFVDSAKETVSKIDAKEKVSSFFGSAKEKFSHLSEINVKEKFNNFVDSAKETVSKIDAKEKVTKFYDNSKETISNILNKGQNELEKRFGKNFEIEEKPEKGIRAIFHNINRFFVKIIITVIEWFIPQPFHPLWEYVAYALLWGALIYFVQESDPSIKWINQIECYFS